MPGDNQHHQSQCESDWSDGRLESLSKGGFPQHLPSQTTVGFSEAFSAAPEVGDSITRQANCLLGLQVLIPKHSRQIANPCERPRDASDRSSRPSLKSTTTLNRSSSDANTSTVGRPVCRTLQCRPSRGPSSRGGSWGYGLPPCYHRWGKWPACRLRADSIAPVWLDANDHGQSSKVAI